MNLNIKNKLKMVLGSKGFKIIIYALGILIAAFLIFQIGFFVGFNKASFGRDWSDNYANNFGPNRNGPRMMEDSFGNSRGLPNAHGAIGRIIKTEFPTVIVMDDKDKIEKIVLVTDNTEIRKMRDKVAKESLRVDDFIVVIGSPNTQGQIDAKLIRFLPSPSEIQSFNKNINRQ